LCITAGHSSQAVSHLGGRAGGATVTHAGGAGHRPAPDYADGRPLLDVVGHRHHHRPVVLRHVLRQLIPVREPGGRAAPDDTKMLD